MNNGYTGIINTMKIVVGLGNPGKEYKGTRHNAGFMVVEKLAEVEQFPPFKQESKFKAEVSMKDGVILVKPQTYMNKSGESASAVMKFYKVEPKDVTIVHDDLDIRLGEYKIQEEKGPKEHRGIQSIEEQLGVKNFWRVRVGVDNRETGNRIPGEDYVLMRLLEEEKKILDNVTEEIVAKLRISVLS